jgi:hypothetical protein
MNGRPVRQAVYVRKANLVAGHQYPSRAVYGKAIPIIGRAVPIIARQESEASVRVKLSPQASNA